MKKRKKIIIIILLIVIVGIFILLQNNLLTTTEYTVDGDTGGELVVVQLSDLHNKIFAPNNNILFRRVSEAAPDIIVITGDLIDSRSDERTIIKYISEIIPPLVEIAPVYFVSGNHDIDNDYPLIIKQLTKYGAIVLDNDARQFTKGKTTVTLCGVADFNGFSDWLSGPDYARTGYLNALDSLASQTEGYRILLAHRPEFLTAYAARGFDLVLTGHAHGGQFRLPFIGGLYAPAQGFFPKFTSGTFTEGNTTMAVSRGLGNSIIPIRLFNYPEIVVIKIDG